MPRSLVVLGGALALTTVGASTYSLALFTSTTSVIGNAFKSGTVVLSTDRATNALIGFTNMVPGDTVTAPLVISNTGTAALRYSMSTTVSGETKSLGSQLQLQVKTLGTGCSAFDGTLLYGNVNPAATSGTPALEALDKPIKLAYLGSSASGQQTGDRILAGTDNANPITTGTSPRSDAASGSSPSSETLCFRAYLPKNATDNTFQDAAVTASFVFDAEQTANNP